MTIVMMIIIILIELKLPSRQMQERLKHEPWHLGGYCFSPKGPSGQELGTSDLRNSNCSTDFGEYDFGYLDP